MLTAYSVDGTNSGTARLGRNVTVQASTPGTSGATIVWSLDGAGTLSSAGVYTGPAAMPANPQVTVTATLATNPSVSASYTMSLRYMTPTIRWITPSTLVAGATNAVSVVGYDFTPATTILVGGTPVPTTLQSNGTVVAQVPVSTGAPQALAIQVSNPVPGGGSSAATQASVQAPKILLTAYSVDGTNAGTARLGRSVTLQASSPGLTNPAYTWTVQGAGTVSSSGIYTAPAAMPSNPSVTVTATLSSNPAISTSYKMSLIYAVPTIRWIQPTNLQTGITNTVTVVGYDFTPATTLLVGGKTVAATLQSAGTLVAQVPIGNTATDSLSVAAQNPSPGGGASAATTATVTPLTIQVDSYNKWGLDPSSDPLGREVQFVATVKGSGNPGLNWPITWSVQGGGTISSTGLYQAPSTMPTSTAVYVKAALAASPTVAATSYLSLVHAAPVINQSTPTVVTPGQTSPVVFTGEGFEPQTVVLVNGAAVTTKYLSPTTLSAQITVGSGATSPLSVSAQNPAPGGGTSATFALMPAGAAVATASVSLQAGLSIPGDFLGLSHDWNDAQGSMGSQQLGVNTIYRQLITNLMNPGSPFFIRIGGGSTDTSVAASSSTIEPFIELANALPVHFSLGVNLGSNNLQLAEQQASFFMSNMPAGSVNALEIGNEPDLYAAGGTRASTYSLANYLSDFATWKQGIASVVPAKTKLMGPSWASPWYMQQNFAALERQQASAIGIVSQHFYEGDQNGTNHFAYDFLLKNSTAIAYVPQLGAAAALAHQNSQLFRMGEMNSIDNGGLSGVSNTFSAALWSVDTMFEYANVGVDGVNFHGTSGCFYCAFSFGVANLNGKHVYTLQQVNPLYYGLLFFHQATTNSARLLPVTVTTTANVKVWATEDQAGTVHVAVLNKDLNFAGTVAVTVPGYGRASVSRMVAPSYQSTAGISIGDQTFDGSLDGTLVGNKTTETLEPADSVYTVAVQPTSAVLLTLSKQ